MAPTAKTHVIIEEKLKAQITAFCGLRSGSCGLIVGQVDAGKYLVTHFVRATKAPATEVEEVNDNDLFRLVSFADDGQGDADPASYEGSRPSDQLDETPAWIYTKERKFCPMTDVQDLVTNAKLPSLAVQVSRLLPGGLQILGIFFTLGGEVPKTVRPRLKELMNEMSIAIQKDCTELYVESEVDDKILLAFEPRSQNIVTSLIMDAADPKSIIKPLTSITYQSLQWTEVQTKFRCNIEKPTELKFRDVEGVLKKLSGTFANSVKSSVCLVNEKFVSMDKTCPLNSEGFCEVSFLTPLEKISDDLSMDEVERRSRQSTSGRLAFKADIVGRAYVHSKANVSFALQALKNDLIRSMTTRMELHCQDYLVTDTDEQEFDVVHELPRRVLAPLNKGKICFSNYLHESERLRDSLEVFVGLLDMDASMSTREVIGNIEMIPNQRDVDSALESLSTHSDDVEEMADETGSMGSSASDAKFIQPAHRDTGSDQGEAEMGAQQTNSAERFSYGAHASSQYQ
ncbi:hypothetical protein RvY_02122-2 [Ramazzottius varieornatus]|uniref:Protein odr-4 homolog n=1 Tax=Ramazzottius varieornatus TaxID=947166 RepID=A0A1D1UTS8_RAMVA|nr:hypothetical protein RvY_02122-2 [Ramazzottius varieornatus]